MSEVLPIGIHWCNKKEKYIAKYTSITGIKIIYCGAFDNLDDAINAYKRAEHAYNIMPKYYYS